MDVPPPSTEQLRNDATTAQQQHNHPALLSRYSRAAINDLLRLSLYMDTSLLQDERSVIQTPDGQRCHPLKVTSGAFGLRPQAVLHCDQDLEFMVTEIELRDRVEPACQHYSRSHMCTNVWYPRRESERAGWTDRPVVCIFGCTPKGESVCVLVRDFMPYFFMQVKQFLSPEDLVDLKLELCSAVNLRDESLIRLEPQSSTHYYGWEPAPDDVTQSRRYPVIKVFLPNVRHVNKAVDAIQADPARFQAVGLGEYDMRKDVVQSKFSVDSGVLPKRWVTVKAADVAASLPDGFATHCQIELDCQKTRQLVPNPQRQDVPPLLVASIDGEMNGSQGFPNYALPNDASVGIGLTFRRYGQDAMTRFYLALHAPGFQPPQRAYVRDSDIVLWFDSEAALHEAYRDLLVVHGDVDIVTTYNGKNFDNEYFEKRMQFHAHRDAQAGGSAARASRFFRLGRFIEDECHVKESGMTTAAKGENKYTHVPMAGRIQYDIYRYVKDDYKKLPDNTLKYVAAKLLPEERKKDLSPESLMNIWRRHQQVYGTKVSMATVCSKVMGTCFQHFLNNGALVSAGSDLEPLLGDSPDATTPASDMVCVMHLNEIAQTLMQQRFQQNLLTFSQHFLDQVSASFQDNSVLGDALKVAGETLKLYKTENCCPSFSLLLSQQMKKSPVFREPRTKESKERAAQRIKNVQLLLDCWRKTRQWLVGEPQLQPEQAQVSPHWRTGLAGLNLYQCLDSLQVARKFYHESCGVGLAALDQALQQASASIEQALALQIEGYATLASQVQKVHRDRLVRECYPFLPDAAVTFPDTTVQLLKHLIALELQLIAVYCIQDCDVVLYLMDHFANITQDIEMARVTFTSVEKLITRGQQLKIYNQLMYYSRQWGFLINDPPDRFLKDHPKYDGAIVLDPKQGFYTQPVLILDFMSLYPSIMREHNLSPDTEVLDPRFLNLPGVEYTVRTLADGRTVYFVKKPVGIHPKLLTELLNARKRAKVNMAKHEKALGVLGVLQDIFSNGLDAATIEPSLYPKLASCQQGDCSLAEALLSLDNFKFIFDTDAVPDFNTSVFMKAVRFHHHQQALSLLPLLLKYHSVKQKQYNCQQLSLKISANSIYGFNGVNPFKKEDDEASKGKGKATKRKATVAPPPPQQPPAKRQRVAMLPCVDVAETVTHIGREMIYQTKNLAETQFQAEVVYGDSVTATTPVLLRQNGVLMYRCIADIPGLQWHSSRDKEFAECEGLEVWSDQGFTKVHRVIRHLVNKPLVQVLTHTGCVTVTEDHSLLRPDGEIVKPSECAVGQQLLCHPLPELPETGNYYQLASVWGLFLAGGEVDDSSWSIRSSVKSVLREAMSSLCFSYPHLPFTLEVVSPEGGEWILQLEEPDRHFMQFWRQNFYCLTTGCKKVPDLLWSANKQSRDSFVKGYRKGTLYHLDKEGELASAGLYWLLSLFYHPSQISVRQREDQLLLSALLPPEAAGEVKLLQPVPVQGPQYVYDLTTDNNHFAAGVGQIVVHNTDSVMCLLPGVNDVKTAFEEGEKVAKFISDSFGGYIVLELENIACPYLLRDKKKNYCKRVWMSPDKPEPDLDIKGISPKRRDTPPFVKKGITHCLDTLMEATPESKDACIQAAQDSVLRTLEQIVNKDIPFQDYIKSMSMKDITSYASDQIVQVRIYNKRKRRRPGSEPHAGDRVDFVVLVPDQETVQEPKLCDLVEDPEYIIEQEQTDRVDRRYYVNHYFKNTIVNLLSICMKQPLSPEGLFVQFEKQIAHQLKFGQQQFQVAHTNSSQDRVRLHYQAPPRTKVATQVIAPPPRNMGMSMSFLQQIAQDISKEKAALPPPFKRHRR